MPITHLLNVYRHDRNDRALITLSGEIDLSTASVLRESLERCLRDGIRVTDVDLTAVSFCDCTGLNIFLRARESAAAVDADMLLHFPCPTLTRLLTITGCGSLLLAFPGDDLPFDSLDAWPTDLCGVAGRPAGRWATSVGGAS